ncbi:Bax inhibitor-1/YccA family protein [Alsobacter sp. SYSU M60028]|uniref:Bax inhibitor-1/YccA family protein n=1 Tax=Alsobacter ponti TaxID=2962936 RepID=A0ABT1LE98_9HYPH|nr:Bax inhibitor-1/YccA family protein [Alsobacter ponti]MCP8939820.1 Bax inhibitor-1/YccA family protein [Alsobacter ponti]
MSNYERNAAAPFGGVARAGTAEYDVGLRAYMLGIYNYMTLALAVSALVALGVFKLSVTGDAAGAAARIGANMYLTGFGYALFVSPLKWLVMLAPLGFVFFLSFRFERMSQSALLGTFLAFAATMGLSLGTIFMVYTTASVVQVLFITAAAFGALSLYGYTTKRSLSAMGAFLVMGLFGLIIASLVNLFVQSSAMQFGISVLGVLIFAGLTAWDTQKLKEQYDYVAGSGELMAKSSIMGALTLYLDFINMFQFLLALFGNRNN